MNRVGEPVSAGPALAVDRGVPPPLARPVDSSGSGRPAVAATVHDPTSAAQSAVSTAARNQREVVLLGRITGHDGAALKELYFLYHRRLARFLTRLTTRTDVAEEIINDTFWVVWQRAGDFRGASLVSTWILGIAYRRALKALQRLRPRQAVEDDGSGEPSEEPWQHAELSEWLSVALTRLPREQRTVLELAYTLGHSCVEIAAIMECPVNTVKTRMYHARRKLKVLLEALGGPA
ncbi:MAG TPA: sigma-70 family RNA polymerase sigma factor [Steroidobacteraceae bacterium]